MSRQEETITESQPWEARLSTYLRRQYHRTTAGDDCPDGQELVRLAALDQEALAGDALYGHVAFCGACRSELAALGVALASPTPQVAPTRRSSPWTLAVIGIAPAVLAATLLYLTVVRPLQRQTQQLALTSTQEKDRLQTRLAELEKTAQSLTGKLHAQNQETASLRAQVSDLSRPATPIAKPTPAPIPRPPKGVEVAQATPDLAPRVPDLSPLLASKSVSRGATDTTATFALIQPVGTRILSPSPRFTWSAVPEASTYTVLVADTTDTIVAKTEAPVTGTAWTLTQKLPRGRLLIWEVHALDRAGKEIAVSQEGRFAVVSEKEAAAVAQTQGEYGNALLKRAAALMEAGLIAEAEATLTQLKSEPTTTPAQRTQAARLLATLQQAKKKAQSATGER